MRQQQLLQQIKQLRRRTSSRRKQI